MARPLRSYPQLIPYSLHVLLLAGFWMAVPAAVEADEPPPALLAALDGVDVDQVRQAAETLLADYSKHPRAADAAEIMGDLHYARGEYLTAAKNYEHAAERSTDDPARARRKLLRGRALLGAGEGGLAARVFEDVLKSAPASSEAKLGLADALMLQGRTERAVAGYSDIAERGVRDPLAPIALAQLIRANDALGRHDEARSAARRLAAEYPQSSEAAGARDRLRRDQATKDVAPGRSDAPTRSGSPAGNEARPGTPAPSSAAPADSTPTGTRYSLQLGAFGNRENAQDLASRLEQWGMTDVRIEEEQRGDRTFLRVRAGDFADPATAEETGMRLRDAHGLSFRVVER